MLHEAPDYTAFGRSLRFWEEGMAQQFLARLLNVPSRDPVPDCDLLRRFAREGDAAAFELILRRHARTVWTACRRILSVEADAEDAFQATFLVLVRKAGTVRGACAGAWLHRVAVNAALQVRRRGDRLGSASAEQLESLPAPTSEDFSSECAMALHEELARLPERYRLPVILCEMEGLSHAEAAKVLGWPIGSVSGRLSRARSLLRKRLTHRGASPALAAPMLAVSPNLVREAAAMAVGAAPVVPEITELTEGVLTMMRMSRVKAAAMWILPMGVLTLATGMAGVAVMGQRPAPELERQATSPLDGAESKGGSLADSAPAKLPVDLLEKRLEAARKVYNLNLARVKGGQGSFNELFGWSEKWLDAELPLIVKQDDRVKAIRAHLERTREVERLAAMFVTAGQAKAADAEAATYYRVEAEIRAIREGAGPQAPNKPAEKPAASDVKKMQGKWRVVSVAEKGRKSTPDEVKGMSWTFEADIIIGKDPNPEPKKLGTFKLDPEKTPRQIDITIEERSFKGIYKFEGDQLIICLRDPEKGRPTEFTAEKGNDQGLIVLEREEK